MTPDLTTFGKAMGNGYPIGGLAGRRDLMERFNGRTGDVLLAGTFNGNPLALRRRPRDASTTCASTRTSTPATFDSGRSAGRARPDRRASSA